MDDDLTRETPDEGLYRAGMPLAKMIVGLAPGGGTVAELMGWFVTDPATKRRDRFMMQLVEELNDLHARRLISVEDLEGSGECSALFTMAIQAAVRSHGEEKAAALKNVAANGALHKPEERHISFIVLGILDRLTEPHISLLRAIGNLPDAKARRDEAILIGVNVTSSAADMVDPKRGLPDENGEPSYVDGRDVEINALILNDLVALGLLRDHLEMTATSVYDYSTDPKENGTDYVLVTNVGRLVLKEMATPPA